MGITPYSFVMGIFLWGILSTCILVYVSSRTKFICYHGVSSIFAILVLSVLRMVVPLDPYFVKVIRSERIYPAIISFLQTPMAEGSKWATPAVFLILIWIIGTLLLSVRFVQGQRKRKGMLSGLRAKNNDERIAQIAERVYEMMDREALEKPPIVQSGVITIPHVFGFRRPTIYLPAYARTLSEEELTAVIAHEIMHCVRRDLVVKLIFQVLCLLFWWNPVLYILREELEQVQELRCDMAVSTLFGGTKKMRKNYMSAIGAILAHSMPDEREQKALNAYSVGFIYGSSKKTKRLSQRLDVISDYVPNRKGRIKVNVICILIAVCTLFLSYAVVIQPWHDAAMEADGAHVRSGSEAVRNEDGTYDLYVNGEYVDTITEEDAQFFFGEK